MMHTLITRPNIVRRGLATIIDYFIFTVLFTVYAMYFGTENENEDGGYSVQGLPALLVIVFWLIYFPLVESITGQTIGHWIAELKVIKKNGSTLSFIDSLKRRLLDGFELGLFGLIAIIAVKNSPHHQRIGDMWAGTLVIRPESTICPECPEKLTLSFRETIKGQYTCPECGKNVDFTQTHASVGN